MEIPAEHQAEEEKESSENGAEFEVEEGHGQQPGSCKIYREFENQWGNAWVRRNPKENTFSPNEDVGKGCNGGSHADPQDQETCGLTPKEEEAQECGTERSKEELEVMPE